MLRLALWFFAVSSIFAVAGPEMPVAKANRRLLIVTSVSSAGAAEYAWLYRFLDGAMVTLGQSYLDDQYKSLSVLAKDEATRPEFLATMRRLSSKETVEAIDLLLNLHGSPDSLFFADGPVASAVLKEELKELRYRRKFRLLYSSACYGANHRWDFLFGGFRTAVGSRKVSTASATEYPAFLRLWSAGHTVGNIFFQTNADPAMLVSDSAAEQLGFPEPDSYKVISGATHLTIASPAK